VKITTTNLTAHSILFPIRDDVIVSQAKHV